MESTHDRRSQRSERVPLQIAVELGHGDFQDIFAADAQNLSKGGISMRAACLPDIGSRLLCRFQCLPSGTVVTAHGEVVWAHIDGERSGEFGLAFVDIDPRTEWLIEEMIAEQTALTGKGSGEAEPAAQVATLELEGSPEGIAARLASTGEGSAVFEQELDLLRLGRGVRSHAPGASGHGSIAAVELRMVGSVPMLAVTVQFGAAEPSSQPQLSEQGEPHDTEPDLMAPEPAVEPELAADDAEPAEELLDPSPCDADALLPRVTLAEFDAQPAPRRAEARPFAQPAALPQAQAPVPQRAARKPAPERGLERDFSTSFVLPDDDAELELEEFAQPAWHPALTRALRALWHALRVLHTTAEAALRSARPHVRGALLRSGSVARGAYTRQLAPQLGALRRVGGQLVGRRRRTTAAPGQARPASGSLGRSLLLGLLGAGATGLAVYAIVPSGNDEIELHRAVQPAPARPAVEASASAMPPARTEPQVANSKAAATRAIAGAAPDPRAVPNAKTVPASSPFAVDVRAAKPPVQGSLRFGASEVPHARRFALRMSKRIVGLQGVADAGGFSVGVLGALSLDRAGPISSAHRAVTRSMIMNKGDRAELSIRFAEGKQPAYQVTAEGSTLYVLLEDK